MDCIWERLRGIKRSRYSLPLLSVGGLLVFPYFDNYIYTPPIVFLVSFILFWNIPILVTYTNSKPLYFEDLFIDMTQLPSIDIQKRAREAFKNYYMWILILTNSLLVSALSNYWLFKTKHSHSYYEIMGITGGILKIFQVVNHYSGTLVLKYIQKTIDKKQNAPELFQSSSSGINLVDIGSLALTNLETTNDIISIDIIETDL